MKHPHFRVVIDVTHHFKQTTASDRADLADQLKEGEQVITLASGRAVRKLVEHDEPYMIDFGDGVIDTIIAERKAAQDAEAGHAAAGRPFSPIGELPFGMLVAKHIEQASMPAHSPIDCWTAIRVESPDGFDALLKEQYAMKRTLQEYLQFYFDLPGETV